MKSRANETNHRRTFSVAYLHKVHPFHQILDLFDNLNFSSVVKLQELYGEG